jgi:type IV fimbrial biogenesis protein FimT
MRSMKNRAQGMTLIELITAMLVLAILMSIAIPSFREFAADSRTTAATSDLVTALNMARSEALRRSSLVVACSSTDGAQCAGSNVWTSGWIVFADRNGDGNVNANELLQTWVMPSSQISVEADANRAVYNSMGMANLPGGNNRVTFTIKQTGCTGDRAKQTRMSLSGSLQTTKIAC